MNMRLYWTIAKCSYLIDNEKDSNPTWLPHAKSINGNIYLMYTVGNVGISNTDSIRTNVYIKNLSKFMEKECSL